MFMWTEVIWLIYDNSVKLAHSLLLKTWFGELTNDIKVNTAAE